MIDDRIVFIVVVNGVFVAVTLALAVMLLVAGFNRTANRALAITLIGGSWAGVFMGILSFEAIAPGIGDRWIFYARHAWFIDGFVIFAFLANYPARRAGLPRIATRLWPYVVLGLGFNAIQLLWPQMGFGSHGTGPLIIPDFLADAFSGLIVPLILLHEIRRGRYEKPLGPLFLVGVLPLYFIAADLMSMLHLAGIPIDPTLSSRGNISASGTTGALVDLLLPVRFLLGIAVLASVAWTAIRHANLRLPCMGVLAVLLGHIALRLAFMFREGGLDSSVAWTAWSIPLTLSSLGFLAYVAFHDQAVGLNRKIRIGISRAALAMMFLGVFFIVAQVAQNYLSEEFGYLTGGIAAGAMLFAVAPLQRVAERLARVDRAPPDDRAADVYREAVELTLLDRAITPREERHLAHLAERLGLAAGSAMDIRLAVQEMLASRNRAPGPTRRARGGVR